MFRRAFANFDKKQYAPNLSEAIVTCTVVSDEITAIYDPGGVLDSDETLGSTDFTLTFKDRWNHIHATVTTYAEFVQLTGLEKVQGQSAASSVTFQKILLGSQGSTPWTFDVVFNMDRKP